MKQEMMMRELVGKGSARPSRPSAVVKQMLKPEVRHLVPSGKSIRGDLLYLVSQQPGLGLKAYAEDSQYTRRQLSSAMHGLHRDVKLIIPVPEDAHKKRNYRIILNPECLLEKPVFIPTSERPMLKLSQKPSWLRVESEDEPVDEMERAYTMFAEKAERLMKQWSDIDSNIRSLEKARAIIVDEHEKVTTILNTMQGLETEEE